MDGWESRKVGSCDPEGKEKEKEKDGEKVNAVLYLERRHESRQRCLFIFAWFIRCICVLDGGGD